MSVLRTYIETWKTLALYRRIDKVEDTILEQEFNEPFKYLT